MEVIPAIDLKGGKCVRLLQGKDDATTEYSDDPAAIAASWVSQGAKRLHVVNLDGAFGRTSDNTKIVRQIAGSVDATVQFGGGLRSIEDIEQIIGSGVSKVVLGTSVVENPNFLGDVLKRFGAQRVIVALDASNGKVATRGWQVVSNFGVSDLALHMKNRGVQEILYTDIKRDGMLAGPDFGTLRRLASTGLHVLASGGVSSNEDVIKLLGLNSSNITGVIIGKALYEKRIALPELLSELRKTAEQES